MSATTRNIRNFFVLRADVKVAIDKDWQYDEPVILAGINECDIPSVPHFCSGSIDKLMEIDRSRSRGESSVVVVVSIP